MTWGAVAGAAVGVIGGALTSHSAGNAAASGANKGAGMDQQTWQQLQRMQSPWATSGGYAQQNMNFRLGIGAGQGDQGYGSLMQGYGQHTPNPFQYTGQQAPGQFNPTAYKDFTIDDFHKMSPAYQFQKQQGMQGVLNTDASGQGALSGAAQKDLIGYNQGMANTSFNTAFGQNMQEQQQRYAQQLGSYQGQLAGYNSQYGNQLAGYQQNLAQQQQGFGQYQQQQQNIYGRLMGVSGLGQQATGQLTSAGSGLSMDTAQGYTNAGTANAWGNMMTGNAITGGGMYAAQNVPWSQVFNGGGNPNYQLPADTTSMPISTLPPGN